MTDCITRTIDRVEVITSVQRRRCWSAEEKVRIVEETYLPGMSVSLVARQHGIAGNWPASRKVVLPEVGFRACWRALLHK